MDLIYLTMAHGPLATLIVVTQRPSLFTLINYCAIVFSFALMFASMRWLL